METVTTVIATHNRSELVPLAIESALGQLNVINRVIVVNDCSTDDTSIMLDQRYANDHRVKIINNTENMGIAYNINFAINLIESDYVALLGDDDIFIDEYKNYNQIKLIKESNLPVFSASFWCSGENINSTTAHTPDINKFKSLKRRILKHNGFICGSSVVCKTMHLKDIKWDEKKIKGVDSDFFRASILNGYQLKMYEKVSTYVNTGPHPRMTPIDTDRSYQTALQNNLYNIRKYNRQLLQNPDILIRRISKLIYLLLKYILYKLSFK